MGIFGHTNLTLDQSTYLHSTSSQDQVTNYTLGLLLLLLLPLGVLCNLLVYFKNHLTSGTPSSWIYRCLAVVDGLCCVVRGGQQVGQLLSPGVVLFYDNTQQSVTVRVIAVVTIVCGICMNTVIAMLCILRLVTIVRPFWARSHTSHITTFCLTYISITSTFSTGVAIHYVFQPCSYFCSVTQWIVPCEMEVTQYIIDILIPLACTSITSLSCLLTIAYLLRSSSSVRRRSSVTVLYMSAGVILWNAMLFGTANSKVLPIDKANMVKYIGQAYEVYYIYYLVTCYFPLLLAVYNSFVIVVRSADIRRMVRHGVRKTLERTTGLVQSASSNPTFVDTSDLDQA